MPAVRQRLWGALGAALAETTALLSPLMGCKDGGRTGRGPAAPFWVLGLWPLGSGTPCTGGRGSKLPTNPSRKGCECRSAAPTLPQ